ncbi:hypothetical protein EJ05DRAFT_511941 [Pseudovirgaria hyperparasitica]|uniref:Integral membrane protein n=1 Tax=Pseudovirgaria hyperparasitica TaxID=470096 RepID=A0A6A6W2Q8_9PEZI|nr:uncharacterized protein EJ05DRAFT_511941 [Pseudovirgaria hyperparasitica]KAF2757218.1 hypothetical protein EJ05DRAFT_511941 [Pseudovirgaria hyperparasitica]
MGAAEPSSHEVTGPQVFWILLQLAFAAMTQRSANTKHTSRKMFLESPDPLRALPVICAADAVIDIITLVRALWVRYMHQSKSDRQPLKTPGVQVITLKLAIFVLAVAPQAIKIFSIKHLLKLQLCAVGFVSSYITGSFIEISGIPTEDHCPVCGTGILTTIIAVLATLSFYFNVAVDLWIWHAIGEVDAGHPANFKVPVGVFYMFIVLLALWFLYLSFGALAQIFNPVKNRTSLRVLRVIRVVLIPGFLLITLLNFAPEETDEHDGSVVHKGKHAIGYMLYTILFTLVVTTLGAWLVHWKFGHQSFDSSAITRRSAISGAGSLLHAHSTHPTHPTPLPKARLRQDSLVVPSPANLTSIIATTPADPRSPSSSSSSSPLAFLRACTTYIWNVLLRAEDKISDNRVTRFLSRETAYVMYGIGLFHFCTACVFFLTAYGGPRAGTGMPAWAAQYLG